MKRLKTVDRLSELPDSLILHILSFLETRDAVKTSLLSKHWVDLWTSIPCLEFNESGKEKDAAAVGTLIDKVLRRWRGTKILKFKIDLSSSSDASSPNCDLDFWFRFATEKKVESLDVCLPFGSYNPPQAYRLPHCLYSGSVITRLDLVGFSLEVGVNVKVQWNNLKTLHLEGLSFSEDVINQVVSSAPQLEDLDLRLYKNHDNLTVRSSSLKCLTIVNYNLKTSVVQYDPSMYTKLTIWAPKLEVLNIEGNAYSKCLIMDVSLLTVACLYFYEVWDVALRDSLMQILPKIQHVEELALSPCSLKMLGVMKGKYSFSPFSNVKTLEFLGGPIKPNEIVDVAEMFPKVETLQIYWKLDEWYPLFLANLLEKNNDDVEGEAIKKVESLWMQLRRVEVTWDSSENENSSIFNLLIDFLMKHATMVQEIVILKEGNDQHNI